MNKFLMFGDNMEISVLDMKKAIEEIYERLEKVTPVDFDCGSLCGEACCVYDLKNPEEELALYLLPGEELMYEDSDSSCQMQKSSKMRSKHKTYPMQNISLGSPHR